MSDLYDILCPSACLPLDATCVEAHALFLDAPGLVAIALLDDARPVALVSRAAFYGQGADGFGHALFDHDPVSECADWAPILVNVDEPLDELSAALAGDDASPRAGFIAVEHGAFIGVGATAAVHRAVAAAANKHAARLAKLTELLENARLKAEAANAAKSRFIAKMNYELRTQLNAIHGYAELISDEHGAGNADLRLDARNIVLSGQHVMGLVNQVLDFARLESGDVEFDPEPIDLDQWLLAVASLIAPLATANGNRLHVVCNAALGEAYADADRLRQSLLHVADNACKFTANGVVTISAAASMERGRRLLLAVEDTGIGMTAGQLEKLFTPFEQTDARIAELYGGNGLGLSIAKQLVELMGGSIRASSVPGQGSRFEIAVPIDAPAAAEMRGAA